MRIREVISAGADAQRVKQLKANAKRAQRIAQTAQQEATMKKAREKLTKLRQPTA